MFVILILLFSSLPAFAGSNFGCKADPALGSLKKQVAELNSLNKPVCQVSNQFDSEERSIAKGARQAMMMLYGSCAVLDLPVANSVVIQDDSAIPKKIVRLKSGIRSIQKPFSAVARAHYYLNSAESGGDAGSCPNLNSGFKTPHSCADISCLATSFPPLYQYGGKADDLNLYHLANYHGQSNTMGIDCSGFISESLMIQGLQFYPQSGRNPNRFRQSFGTAEMHEMGRGGDCFRRPASDSVLRPGDLLVGPHHVAAIDGIGSDPFGIDAHLKVNLAEELQRIFYIDHHSLSSSEFARVKSSLNHEASDAQSTDVLHAAKLICNDWTADASQFKVSIIHSSPDNGQLGVQREKMVPALGGAESSSVWVTSLQDRARSVCAKRVFESIAEQAKISLIYPAPPNPESSVVVLRHDSDRKDCRTPKDAMPQVPGLDCVKCCATESRYENLVPENAKIFENHFQTRRAK